VFVETIHLFECTIVRVSPSILVEPSTVRGLFAEISSIGKLPMLRELLITGLMIVNLNIELTRLRRYGYH